MRNIGYLALPLALFVLSSMAVPYQQNTFETTKFECDTKHDCPGNEVCAGKSSPLVGNCTMSVITNLRAYSLLI